MSKISIYDRIKPTVEEYCVCPFCNVNSAVMITKYGYPRHSHRRDDRGYWHENHYPSQESWLLCGYCEIEVHESALENY